jgi:hypothetical protein
MHNQKTTGHSAETIALNTCNAAFHGIAQHVSSSCPQCREKRQSAMKHAAAAVFAAAPVTAMSHASAAGA